MQTFTIPLTDALAIFSPAGQLIVIYEDATIISVAYQHGEEGTRRLLSLAMLQSSMFEEVWQQVSDAMRTHAIDTNVTDSHSHLLINPS